ALRRGLRAVSSCPEIDVIQITGQDLLLRKPGFEPQGQHDLLHLAAGRALGREIGQPGQLLGDRAAAFERALAPEVAPASAEYPAQINPATLEEAPDLDRD